MDTLDRDPVPRLARPAPDAPARPTRAGRRQALTAAAVAYRPRLLVAAERILGDAAEAEDAVQDALLCALRSLDRFRGDSQLTSWLYRITTNCALMRLRSRRRRPTRSLEDPGCPAGEPSDREALRADEELVLREQLRATGAALARLSEVQRQALWLRGVDDLSVPEVGRRIGRSASAAKMLVHRARERVREDLAST